MKKSLSILLTLATATLAMAANRQIDPTKENVSYGPHERQKLNFWKAESKEPTPVLIDVQGGGYLRGGGLYKTMWYYPYLHEGISIVSVSYRLADKPETLVPTPILDVARAVQFVRSKADEWGIDKNRLGMTGHSAGGNTVVWLVLHDDLADPNSKDPVLRESSKPTVVLGRAAQTFIDIKMVKEFVGPKTIGHGMIWKTVGAKSPQDAIDNYKKFKKVYQEYSPINHLDKDDPPVFLRYNDESDNIHSARFGYKLREEAKKVGAKVYVYGRKLPKDKVSTYPQGFTAILKGEKPKPAKEEIKPKKKNISFLIINQTNNFITRGDFDWFQRLHKQGFDIDIHFCGNSALTWDLVRNYNVLVILNLPLDHHKWSDKPDSVTVKSKEVLERYLKAGGGIFFMPYLSDESTISIEGGKAWSGYLDTWGIKICHDFIFDDKATAKHPKHGREFIYTDKISPSPVSKGVKGIWFPCDTINMAHRYPNSHGMPIFPVGKGWQVVVRGGDSSYTKPIPLTGSCVSRYSKKELAQWKKSRFFSPDYSKPPALFAIRDFDHERMAITVMRPIYHLHSGSSWIHDGVVLDKGLNGIPSDFEKLFVNTIRWLGEPSYKSGKLGGYEQDPKVITHPHFHKTPREFFSEFNSYQNYTPVGKVYKGIIGAQSKYSSGKGTIKEWADAARSSGLDFVVFLEEFTATDENKMKKLEEECLKNSDKDLILIPGFTIKNNVGNYEWYQGFGQKRKMPPAKAIDDQGRLIIQGFDKKGNLYFSSGLPGRDWRWVYVDKRNSRNIGYYNFKNSDPGHVPPRNLRMYGMLGIVTYVDGKLVEDITDDYMALLPQANTPRVCAVSILKSPEEMKEFVKTKPYLTNVVAKDIKDVPHRMRYGSQYGGDNVSASSGPKIQAWAGCRRVFTYAGESFVTERFRIRQLAKVTSDVGLKEIRIHRSDGAKGTKLYRRILLNGEKEYSQIFKWGFELQSAYILEAIDVKGGRAISTAFEFSFDGNWNTWCADRYNGELFHGPITVNGTWESGVRNPYSVGVTWDGGGSLTKYTGFNLKTDNPVLVEEDSNQKIIADNRKMEGITYTTCIDDTVRNIGGHAWNVYAPGKVSNGYNTWGPIKPATQMKFNVRRTEYLARVEGPLRDTHAMWSERDGGALAMYEGEITLLKDMKINALKQISLLNLISFFGDNKPVWVFRKDKNEPQPQVVPDPIGRKRFTIQPGGYLGVFGSKVGTPSLVFNLGDKPVVMRRKYGQNYAIDLSGIEGKEFKKQDKLNWKLLYVYDGMDHDARNAERAEYIWRYFGLDGKGGTSGLKVKRGKVLSTYGLVDLSAKNGIVEFTVPEPKVKPSFDVPLGVRFFGLNPNWTVGLLQKNGYTPGYYNKTGKNLYRNLGIDDQGLAFLAVYTKGVPLSHFIAGHPVVADNQDLNINVVKLSDTPVRWLVNVNNPTDKTIRTKVKVNIPELGIPLKERKIEIAPGGFLTLLDPPPPPKPQYISKNNPRPDFLSRVKTKTGYALRINLTGIKGYQLSHQTGVTCQLKAPAANKARVTFDAKRIRGGRILQIRRPAGGSDAKNVMLSSDWTTNSVDIDSGKVGLPSLIFTLAKTNKTTGFAQVGEGIFEIKNVKVFALNKTGKPVGDNIIINGTFAENTDGWSGNDKIKVIKKNKTGK